MSSTNDLAISPDGASVYASRNFNSIRAFSRNGSTGAITGVQDSTNGSGGVTGLGSISGIEVSPDGAYVYASAASSDGVAIFSRDAATSELTFVGTVTNNQNGVSGLDGVNDLAISADGSFVFTISALEDTIVAFTRNPVDGTLSFVGKLTDEVGGVDGLDGADGLQVAPDGGHVYATSANDDAISTFAINPGTGALTFQGCLGDTNAPTCPDDGDTVEGLGKAGPFAIVPSGAHAYVTASDDDAVSAFALEGGGSGDVAAPETTITFGPAQGSSTLETTHTFGFLSSEPGSTFECQIDGAGGFSDCDSPFTTAEQAAGPHTFEVRATDPAGNTDATPATRGYTIVDDVTPPETTITGGPGEGSTVPAGGQTFTFESNEAGSTFECKVNGSPWQTCHSPSYTGVLNSGANTFQVRATDSAMNTDATPAMRHFTVDPPETEISDGPAQDSTIGDSTPTFTFTANIYATFQCSVDGAGFGSCSSPFTTEELADGPHNFRVRAIDVASNVDPTPAERDFTVDTGSDPGPKPACSDGVDNDNDGKIDFPADPGCTNAADNNEADPVVAGNAACEKAEAAVKKAKTKLKKATKKLKKAKKAGSKKKAKKKLKKAKKAQKKAKKKLKKAKKKKRKKC